MRARSFAMLAVLLTALVAVSSVFNIAAVPTNASSHREAPLISQDPAADNTDLYAFVTPDRPDTVTIIACFYPGQDPAGGPNFYRFGDDVLYDIKIDNDHDAVADLIYRFDFATDIQNPNTFLYNTGLIESLDDPDWNLRQRYTITRITDQGEEQLPFEGIVPPSNIGPKSTPNYRELSDAARFDVEGMRVFAGQSDDPFWVDLSIFDLLSLRGEDAVDDLAGFNVMSIALQIPIADLTADGSAPTDTADPNAVLGIWSTTNRFSTTVINPDGSRVAEGDLVQVSRLGMPLVNEVVAPLGAKDLFNASQPVDDAQFLGAVTDPEFARLLNAIYGIEVPPAPRDDLVAVFLTGVGGLNFVDGAVPSEMLRLNVAIPPTPFDEINPLGVLGGDLAGFPNGRRLQDEVIEIVVRAAAGVLSGPEFNVEPNNALDDGVNGNDVRFLGRFPYVGVAHSGAEHEHQAFAAPVEETDAGQSSGDSGQTGDTGDAAAGIQVDVQELNASGVTCDGLIAPVGDAEVRVNLACNGATGDHPTHIHEGTCNDLNPNPIIPLTSVNAQGVSETVIPVAFEELRGFFVAGPHAINIHLSDAEIGTYVACGNIVP